jgi:hydrogenase nickel incorporation protein HypA/HybF
VHELAISRSLLNLAEGVARQHGGAIRRVVVRIGPLSGVETSALRHAYPLAAAGTAAAGSELEIETTAVVVLCPDCGATTRATANNLLCGTCGNWRTELASGDELLLVRVELTQQEAEADV